MISFYQYYIKTNNYYMKTVLGIQDKHFEFQIFIIYIDHYTRNQFFYLVEIKICILLLYIILILLKYFKLKIYHFFNPNCTILHFSI